MWECYVLTIFPIISSINLPGILTDFVSSTVQLLIKKFKHNLFSDRGALLWITPQATKKKNEVGSCLITRLCRWPPERTRVTCVGRTEDRKEDEAGEQIFRGVIILLSLFTLYFTRHCSSFYSFRGDLHCL